MPIIETRHFKYVTADGADADLPVKLEVNKAGLFQATIPPVFEKVIDALRAQHTTDSADSEGTGYSNVNVAITTAGNVRLSAKQLVWVTKLISDALRDYSAPDVKSEIVIRYAVRAQCKAWEMPNRCLASNGYVAEAFMKESGAVPSNSPSVNTNPASNNAYGYWAKGLDEGLYCNQNPAGFSLLLFAGVRTKTTTTRGASVKTEYTKTVQNTWGSLEPMDLLNSVLITEPAPSSGISIMEMPYSDEAALFFYNILMDIATLSLRLTQFFTDKDRLSAAITGQSMPKLELHTEIE